MRGIAWIAVALWSFKIAPLDAQPSSAFDPRQAIYNAVRDVRKVAMNRDRLDWAAIEARAQRDAVNAKDDADLLPIYARILDQLNDYHHSSVVPSAKVAAVYASQYGNRDLLPDLKPRPAVSRYMTRTSVSGQDVRLPNGRIVRQVVVPAYEEVDEDGVFATSVLASLTATPTACGYIVDLRGDTGGNMFPPLVGLLPLLGEGYRMAIPTDTGMGLVVLEHGAANGYENASDRPVRLAGTTNWTEQPLLATAPVAVLTDDATASAGEGIAVQFRSRPMTRSFGTITRKHASANIPVPVSGGVTLMVTANLFPDRTGRTYFEGLPPDAMIPQSPENAPDGVVAAAASWLSAQSTCLRPLNRTKGGRWNTGSKPRRAASGSS